MKTIILVVTMALLTLFAVALFSGIDINGALKRYYFPTPQALPILHKIEPFQFLHADGSSKGSADLMGKVWVTNFIFTSCAGPCPLLSKKMAFLQLQYKDEPAFRSVSFTVDAATDTPAVLNEYAKRYSADLARWYFLTGNQDDIQKTMTETFKIGHGGKAAFHSNYFVLIDKQNRIRGYYSGEDEKAFTKLNRDIKELLKETL